MEELDPNLFDVEIEEETVIPDIIEEPEEIIDEPVEEPPFVYTAEVVATPEGGMKTFYQYLKKNLDYPRQARRMGVQGKVFVEFIVGKDGTLEEVTVLRGIGAGCDEEASRLIEESPKWKPAKQRGRPVRMKMTIPIFFKLN